MAIKDLRNNLKRIKEADPVELAGQLNTWLHESGESLRLRIEDEVEKAVTKRGFVKRSDFAKLEARISALEGKKSATNSKKKSVKKPVKKSVKKPVKKPVKKAIKKSVKRAK